MDLYLWSYPFAELQSVYSTAPADWARQILVCVYIIFQYGQRLLLLYYFECFSH